MPLFEPPVPPDTVIVPAGALLDIVHSVPPLPPPPPPPAPPPPPPPSPQLVPDVSIPLVPGFAEDPLLPFTPFELIVPLFVIVFAAITKTPPPAPPPPPPPPLPPFPDESPVLFETTAPP